MQARKPTEQFWAAVDYCYKHSKFHSQKELALVSGMSTSTVHEIIKRKKAYVPKTQTKIANAFGYDLIDFLTIGRELIDRNIDGNDLAFKNFLAGVKERQQQSISQASGHGDSDKTIPIDPATRILHEALSESGIIINDNQKKAGIRILREELEKTESQTKERIKGMLKALTGTEDKG